MPQVLIHRRGIVLALVALISAMVVGGTAVYAATTVTGGGAVQAVKIAIDSSEVWTEPVATTDIPGMSVTMNVPSGTRSVLLITFSASTACSVRGDLI